MKSIGVFGDSFTGDASTTSIKYHWSTLLAKHFDCEMKNYGMAGSSIYFSYKQFLENHHKHDLNIFLITEISRYIKPVTLYSGQQIYIPSLTSLESNYGTEIYIPKREDLIGWFMSSDESYNNDMACLMLEKIYSISNNIIFIPCFGKYLSPEIKEGFFEKNVIDMFELQKYQANLYGIDVFKLIETHSENKLIISGHFVPEINELIYNSVVSRIISGFWFSTVPNNIEFKYAFNEAFIKK